MKGDDIAVVRCNRGFSLVEVLAAVSVMALMLLALLTMFNGSVRYASIGTQNSSETTRGRSLINQIARELSMAVVDDTVAIVFDKDADYYPVLGDPEVDTLTFVTLSGDPEKGIAYTRSARQVRYSIRDYNNGESESFLHRQLWVDKLSNELSDDYSCYSTNTWGADWVDSNSPELALDFVQTFRVDLYDTNFVKHASYDSTVLGAPVCADIYIEIVTEDVARRASFMPAGAGRLQFERNNSQRFFRRVYFENYLGYNK